MKAAILEIRDGIATGPLHQPVPVIGRNTPFDDEAVDWPTLCGVRGHAYQRAALRALGHTTDCFECAVAALTTPKKPTETEERPRSQPTNRSPRECPECGTVFTPYWGSPRRRYCSKPCYFRGYYRENREQLNAYKRDWMRRRRGTVDPSPQPCEECGELFTGSIYGPRSVRRFCSATCRTKSWKARRAA